MVGPALLVAQHPLGGRQPEQRVSANVVERGPAVKGGIGSQDLAQQHRPFAVDRGSARGRRGRAPKCERRRCDRRWLRARDQQFEELALRLRVLFRKDPPNPREEADQGLRVILAVGAQKLVKFRKERLNGAELAGQSQGARVRKRLRGRGHLVEIVAVQQCQEVPLQGRVVDVRRALKGD